MEIIGMDMNEGEIETMTQPKLKLLVKTVLETTHLTC